MKVHTNVSLSEITYYKIGGKAKYLLDIENSSDLEEALKVIQKNNIKNFLCLGLGSNIVIPNTEFEGAILHFLTPKIPQIQQNDQRIKVFASHHLDDVIEFGFLHNLIGLEWAGGLPSTVGAAVRGNVGAFGGEIKDNAC